jgi:phosphate transport system substrate-binding protein
MRLFLLVMACAVYPLVGSEAVQPVQIEGSSTVYPITVAVAERISQASPQLSAQVVCSGSSAGLRRLVAGEIPIADASRPVNEEELATAAAHGIELIELPIALDALTFVVNPKNTFVTSLTVEELRRLWQPGSTITTWSQLRKGWPESQIELYSMGKDSGTFDFMTEVIVGKARAIRADLAGASQDPQQLIQGIVTHDQAIGYFGHAYFRQNAAMLRAVPIDDGRGPVMPSTESILNRTYRPLSRPLFIYVNRSEADRRSEVAALIASYLRLAPEVVPQVGYVPLSARNYEQVQQRFANRVVGSAFTKARPEDRLDDLLVIGQAKAATAEVKPAAARAAAAPSPAAPVSAQGPAAPASAAAATTQPGQAAPPSPAPVASRPATAAPAGVAAPAANPWLPVSHSAADGAHAGWAPEEALLAIDHLRSASLELARLALADGTPIAELERREQEVRSALARLAGAAGEALRGDGRLTTVGDLARAGGGSPAMEAGYPALIGRIELNDGARGIIDAPSFERFKKAALELADPEQRSRLMMALCNPSAANLQAFAEIVAGLGLGRGEANLILCYARSGLVVR